MEDSIAVQEQTQTGPGSSLLSPEKLAEIRERARAEVQVKVEMAAVERETGRLKQEVRTAERRKRKAAGIAKREKEQVDMIRRMTPAEREHFKVRGNFRTAAMQTELDRLDLVGLETEVPEYQPSMTVGQASEEELIAELGRRGSLTGDQPKPDLPSEPDTQTPMKEATEAEDDNALEETPARIVEPVPREKKGPGRPAKMKAE